MCIALEMAQEINSKIEQAKKLYDELTIKTKVLEDAQNDILHKIESMDKFDLYEGWKLTKSLHLLRIERRNVKNEKYNLEIFLSNVKEVDSKKIKMANQRQINADFEKKYKKRVSDFSNPIEDMETTLNIINNSKTISRTGIQKKIKATDRIYGSQDKLPKEQGTSIKFQLKGNQTDINNTYTQGLISKYKSYKMLDNNVIYLINRL